MVDICDNLGKLLKNVKKQQWEEIQGEKPVEKQL